MVSNKNINEAQIDSPSTLPDAPKDNYNGDRNIANVDQNLNINEIFVQTQYPSLARQISVVSEIHGAIGGVFNIREKNSTNEVELVRRNFELFPVVPIASGITREAVQDMESIYGGEAKRYLCTILKSMSNNQENQRLLTFLKEKCVDRGSITCTEPLNAEMIFFNMTLKVHQCILEANSKHIRTFASWAIVPYRYLAGLASLGEYANGELTDADFDSYVLKTGLTHWYINPDPSDNNVYVGLIDRKFPARSSLFFGEMACDLRERVNPQTGNFLYEIWNRFGITSNPLHENNDPMLFKFEMKGVDLLSTDINTIFNSANKDETRYWDKPRKSSGSGTSDAGAGEGSDSGDRTDLDVDDDI
jgi:hypothetical protein